MYNYKIANINESLNKDFWKYHETKQYINNLVGNESNLINDRIDRLAQSAQNHFDEIFFNHLA